MNTEPKPKICEVCDEPIEEGHGIEPMPNHWLCLECYDELYENEENIYSEE